MAEFYDSELESSDEELASGSGGDERTMNCDCDNSNSDSDHSISSLDESLPLNKRLKLNVSSQSMSSNIKKIPNARLTSSEMDKLGYVLRITRMWVAYPVAEHISCKCRCHSDNKSYC